jgi:hypothetical protein
MSQLEVDKIIPQSGTTLTIGDSGDTITISAGATLSGSLNADNLDSGTVPTARVSGAYTGITQTGTLTSFASTGIDDNATSTAITIDSGQRVRINNTTSTGHGNIYNLIVGNESSGGDSGILITAPNNENSYVSFGDSDGVPGLINYNHISDFLRTYVNGSERMRITSAGLVGIGTSSPSKRLHVEGAGSTYALIKSTNAGSGTGLYFQNATSNYLIGAGSVSGGSELVFYDVTNSTERMRINSNGNVGIGTTLPSQALDVVGSIEVSDGIYIGGTAAANKLDDYEEGTWTPTVNSGVTSPTYSLQSGSYTKIGRMVYFNFDIRVSGGTLVAGDFILEGLPFNNSSNAELADGGASFIYTLDVTTETGKNLPTINLSANNDIMNFYGVDGLRWLGTDMQNNTFIIIASGCYQTD